MPTEVIQGFEEIYKKKNSRRLRRGSKGRPYGATHPENDFGGGVGYAEFQRIDDSRADTPDHADFDVTDLDLRIGVKFDTPGAGEWYTLFSKGNPPGSADSSFYFLKRGTTDLTGFRFTFRDAVQGSTPNDSATGLAVASPRHYRITLDVDNGAAGYDLKFWKSDDPISSLAPTWTQHGSTITGAFVADLVESSRDAWIGQTFGGQDIMRGRVYYAQVRNGIDGTIVANADFRDAGTTATTFTDTTGKVWTLRGGAQWRSG